MGTTHARSHSPTPNCLRQAKSVFVGLVCLPITSSTTIKSSVPPTVDQIYQTLQRCCYGCHCEEIQQAGINFPALLAKRLLACDRESWRRPT